jgi:hypothetical protein
MTGDKNHFYGKTHTQEVKEKIRQAKKGKVWNNEQRQNLSKVRKKQFEGKRPDYLICTSHSEETKEKIRKSAINRKKISCPHCHILSSPHVAKRWHFDNCKQRTEMGM